MDVYWIPTGRAGLYQAERHEVEDLESLLAREDGFVWVDVPECDQRFARVLSEVFGFHSLAVRDCLERALVPKIQPYPDHLFVILHAPEAGEAGQVHLLELDQFIGRRYLVTVHGPLRTEVPLEAALRETRAVRGRINVGRFRPASPAELSYAIVSGLTRRLEAFVWSVAGRRAALEERVMQGHAGDPAQLLEELFRLRHQLLTVRTIAAQSREIYARMAVLAPRCLPPEGRPFIEDLLDQFDRVRNVSDGEKEFLQGVLDFYQTQTATKMNIAVERLALLTATLLPVTAVASIYGMNLIVSEYTQLVHLSVVLLALAVVVALMLQWTKRQGWW